MRKYFMLFLWLASGYLLGQAGLLLFPNIRENAFAAPPAVVVTAIHPPPRAAAVQPGESPFKTSRNNPPAFRRSAVLDALKHPHRWYRFDFGGVSNFAVNREEFKTFGLPTDRLEALEAALLEIKRSQKEAEEASFEILYQDKANVVILIPKQDGTQQKEMLRRALKSYAGNDGELENFLYDSAIKKLGSKGSQLSGVDKAILLSRKEGKWLLSESSFAPWYTADQARKDRTPELIRPRMGGGRNRVFDEIPEEYSHLLEQTQETED